APLAMDAAACAPPLLIVTHRDYFFLAKDEASLTLPPEVLPRVHYLLEPESRNTAAAMAAAAHWVRQHVAPDAVMLVLPADHLIEPALAFAQAVHAAAAVARQGKLVMLGIAPTAPETGYGYIECGAGLPGSALRQVQRFVEKPALAAAQAYARDPDFLWNSGIFCLRADALLAALAEHRPALAQGMAQCWQQAEQIAPKVAELPASFAQSESIAIDYAVMERSDQLAVLPVHFTWNDIGSWNALAGLVAPDAAGNRLLGDAQLQDCTGCYVHSEGRVVAAIGLRGLMLIDTPDALLVADAGRMQEVKQLVEQLQQRGHESARLHRTVTRPWGTYTVLDAGPRYKIKRIEVKPGAALSLQLHHHRSEHWVVVSGSAKVTTEGSEFVLLTDQSSYIPAGQRHRLENLGSTPLVMIEVQSGDILSEDDIVRFDDRYGRLKPAAQPAINIAASKAQSLP
ncbi:MAG: mannose-1-phosphate guanylyltransferase/mannose-6-phosphate isomerase, partial [Burkholderiaceae bacterium]